MKQLAFFLVLLLVLGIAGFLYRYTLENPTANTNSELAVCTLEARVCPDGSSVGRVAPSCEFAACPLPNYEVAKAGIAFVIPAGYRADTGVLATEPTLSAVLVTTPLGDTDGMTNRLVVHRFPIPEGETANDVMLRETTFDPSGMPAESMQEFTPVIVNGKTFQKVVIERFEGYVRVYYYLPRATSVLRFEAVDAGVDWTNPDLVVDELPAQRAMMSLLASLQLIET